MKTLLPAATIFLSMFAMVHSGFTQNWQSTGAPNKRWHALACSADGTKLAAVVERDAFIYASTNSGSSWFLTGAPSNSWTSIASSADGVKLVATAAVIYNATFGGAHGGLIYTSRDSGANWQAGGAPSNQWSSVASSADGSVLVAAAVYNNLNSADGLIFVSTDSGASWSATSAPTNRWNSVAASVDGTKLVAGASGLFTSTNSGATWISNSIAWDFPSGSPIWDSVACSADGATLLALRGLTIYTGGSSPRVYVSTNSGSTWTWSSLPNVGRGFVGLSADGSRLMASKGHLYISANSGVTWLQQNIPGERFGWGSGCVASSVDGGRLFLGLGADDYSQPNSIYTYYSPPRPHLSHVFSSSNLTLSWVVPSASLVIERNSELTTTNWVTITNVPTLNSTNLRNQVILPCSNGNDFYRLATP